MRRSARSQVRRVFTVPTAAGIGLMYAFYGMIMFFNDGSFTAGELAGLVSCLGLAAAVAAALWCVYRLAVRGVFRVLGL